MKKTFIYVILVASIGFWACTVNIGDKKSENDKAIEKKESKSNDKVMIDNNSNQPSTRPIAAKVYIDAVGNYSVAIGKEKPHRIDQGELKGYLHGVKAPNSDIYVALYADEYADYGSVTYVMRITQELKINLIFEYDKGNEKQENPKEAYAQPQTGPINQPKQKPSAELTILEEEQLALRQQRIADSIAEAQIKAKKKAEALLNNFSFDPTNSPSNNDGACGTMAPGRGESSSDRGYNLSGRSLVGKIPQPSNDFNQEGIITVQIRVSPEGKVVEARHIGGSISDSHMIQTALEAAKKARFSQSNSTYDQIGTITYAFKFQ